MTRKQLDVWKVSAGSLVRFYFTSHHAEQMAEALRGNGMTAVVTQTKLPNDALTRLSIH